MTIKHLCRMLYDFSKVVEPYDIEDEERKAVLHEEENIKVGNCEHILFWLEDYVEDFPEAKQYYEEVRKYTVPSEEELRRFRKKQANRCAFYGIDYDEALSFMIMNECFSTWTRYELSKRPVDVEELVELIAEEMGY